LLVGSFGTTKLPVGTDTVVVIYLGDNNFLGTHSSPTQLVYAIPQAPSTLTIQW